MRLQLAPVQTAILGTAALQAEGVCTDTSTGSLCRAGHVHTPLNAQPGTFLAGGKVFSFLHVTSPKNTAPAFKGASIKALSKE